LASTRLLAILTNQVASNKYEFKVWGPKCIHEPLSLYLKQGLYALQVSRTSINSKLTVTRPPFHWRDFGTIHNKLFRCTIIRSSCLQSSKKRTWL